MPEPDRDLGAHGRFTQLRSAQNRVLHKLLARCAGEHALLLDASGTAEAPVLPLVRHWTRLHLAGACWRGDLIARIEQPLPYLDESFDLLLLRHAHQSVTSVRQLLGECIRLLAPGGSLVICGVHPFSLWAPWFWHRTRGCRQTLVSPDWLARQLRRAQLPVEVIVRAGSLWPTTAQTADNSLFGGGYVVLARKRRHQGQLIRLKPVTRDSPINANLATGARRHSA